MSTRILLTALLTAALTTPMLAQTEAPPVAPQPTAAPARPTAAEGATPAAVPAAAVNRDKDTLSVDFPDEDIKTILRNVADLFELNLVVPDTVVGKTTIKMHDVTWRQIFQNVLAPIKFTYVEDGNIIKIVSNETLLDEPGTTEVFILNNAKAADIKPTIDGLVEAAKGGKIVIDARSNSLVITERPSRMSRIRGIIEQLDKATDQVMIESKFVEVTDRDIRNIGVNWASLSGVNLGVSGINQTVSRNRGQTFSNGGGVNQSENMTSGGATSTSTTTNTGAASTSTTQSNSGTQLAVNAVTGLPTVVPVASTGTTTSTSNPSSQTNSTNVITGPTDTLTTALNSLNSLNSHACTRRVGLCHS